MTQMQSDAQAIIKALSPGGGAPESPHPGEPLPEGSSAESQKRWDDAYQKHVSGLLAKPASKLSKDEQATLMKEALGALLDSGHCG